MKKPSPKGRGRQLDGIDESHPRYLGEPTCEPHRFLVGSFCHL